MRAHLPLFHSFSQESLITNKLAILTIATNYMVVGFAEVDFLDAGENDLNPTETAFADYSWFGDVTSYGAAKAIDGNAGTDWVGANESESSSNRLPTKWWCEFSASLNAKKIAIRSRNVNSGFLSNSPAIFQILRWTGIAWQPIKTFFESADWGVSERRVFDISTLQNQSQFNKRLWAVRIHNASDNGSYKSMSTVQIIDNSIDVAQGKKCYGLAGSGNWTAANLVDNNQSTFWASAESNNCRVIIDLGAVYNPTSMSISVRNDGFTNQAPGGLDIEYYDFVNMQWVSVYTTTGLTWTNGETKTFNF